MSSTAFPISAEEANRRAGAEQRVLNAARRVPKLPAELETISRNRTIHIYNVGPWAHHRELGTAGSFRIPKCEPGEKFSRMAPIPGIPIDLKVTDERNMDMLLEEGGGRYLAEQIVGIGMHMSKNDALTKVGVFIGAEIGTKAMPQKAELEAAYAELDRYAEESVIEARRAHEIGPKEAEATIRDKHHWAAKHLNLDPKVEPWMGRRTAVARESCMGCGSPIDGTPILCPNCKFVLDPERYEKNKARFA